MKYIPRYEEPKRDNKNYYSDINQLYRDGFGMPNCTCYSLGRWIEILGYVLKLSVGSAWRWYDYTQDGYKRGQVPKLGAIACWVHKDRSDYGHVAVVEDFNNDYINCSNSAYQSTNFYMKKYYKSDNYNFGDFIFKGFIYLPIEFEEDKPAPKPTKSIDELAKEVIEGKWGNNPERKERLLAAGYDYDKVQNRVNEILNESKPTKKLAVGVKVRTTGTGKETSYGEGKTAIKGLEGTITNYIEGRPYPYLVNQDGWYKAEDLEII